MSHSPKPFYAVGGSEYGIKDKYIDTLTQHYGKKEEYPSVSDCIDFLSVKHLIKVHPALYVIRYDENFVSSIDVETSRKIRSLRNIGTIFCVYSDPKHIAKLDKFIPEFTCSVDAVDFKYIEKYLHKDFPGLDDRSIKIAAKCSSNYGHARTICKSMINANPEILAKMPEDSIIKLFGCGTTSVESDIQKAIAGRNFVQAVNLIESYEGDFDSLIYTVLQTMIELEKILTSKYSESDLKDYVKFWKIEDIYHMFMNGYDQLEKLRSNTSTDVKSSLIYLFGLFTFKDVPSTEVMNSDC